MNPVKESEITMASVEKFSAGAVRNQLRHNCREIEHSSNTNIDPTRQERDYLLSPDRGISDYDYLKKRLSQLYVYNRKDVKVMAGWVVTAPQELPVERQEDFFVTVYDFLEKPLSTMMRVGSHICIFISFPWQTTQSTMRASKCVQMRFLTAVNCAIFIQTCNAT